MIKMCRYALITALAIFLAGCVGQRQEPAPVEEAQPKPTQPAQPQPAAAASRVPDWLRSASASAAKEISKNISKDISHITTEVKTAKSAAIKSTSTLLKGSMTILVILRFLFRVA